MARKTTGTLDKVEGGFKCSLCPKVLARQGDMPRHLKTHMADKEHLMHRCPYPGCDFKNLQRKNVETHIRIHTGQKSEICPDCEFRTTDPGSLTRHRKRFHNYVPRQRRPRQPTSGTATQGPVLAPEPATSLNEPRSWHDADTRSLSTRSVSPQPWSSSQSSQRSNDPGFESPYLSGQSCRSLTDSYPSSTLSSPAYRLPTTLPPLRPVSPGPSFYDAPQRIIQPDHRQLSLPPMANTLPPIRTVLAEAAGRSPFDESRSLPPLVNVGQVPRPNLPSFDQYSNFTAYPVMVSTPQVSIDTFSSKKRSRKIAPDLPAMLLPDLDSDGTTQIFLKEVEPSLLASPEAHIVKKTLMHPSQIIWFWDSSLRRFWSPNAKVVLPAIEVGKPVVHPHEIMKDTMTIGARRGDEGMPVMDEECVAAFLQNVLPLNKATDVGSGSEIVPARSDMDLDDPLIDEAHRQTSASGADAEAALDAPSTPIRSFQVDVEAEDTRLPSPLDMDLLGSFMANTTQEEFQTMTCELCGMDPDLQIPEPSTNDC